MVYASGISYTRTIEPHCVITKWLPISLVKPVEIRLKHFLQLIY